MKIKPVLKLTDESLKGNASTILVALVMLFLVIPGPFHHDCKAQPISREISQGWSFRLRFQNIWFNAAVPGTLHTDLIQNGLLSDPYDKDNEKNALMLENEGVEYLGKFEAGPEIVNSSHVELIFEGIDTYAAVWLNNKKLFDADNMFRTYRIDIKSLLKKGRNDLNLLMDPAVKRGKELAAAASVTLPGDEKVYTRKAAYQYGWDWGPRLVTTGLWRPVRLFAWNNAVIRNANIQQLSCDKKEARLVLNAEIECDKPGKYTLALTDKISGEKYVSERIRFDSGYNQAACQFPITDPRLWWCNGLGESFLYRFSLELISNNLMLDNKDLRIGIRTVEVVREADQAAWESPLIAPAGKSFYIKLNGIPVFMKGANYIPPDNFMPRADSSRYAAILDQAVKSNMNMLRVWGGGNYESDVFYDLCDEKGLLVWQDFMFACAMYPGDAAFLKSVEREAIDNVIRLRQHPCIALWCGNNEVDEGWKNWGWQKQFNYSAKDSADVWHNYQAVFHKLLPDVVKAHDPGRFYWPSSPSIGWGRKESLQEGDSHYWGVWWGMEDFSVYERKVGRFMSEYGFQGFPDLQTIAGFTKAKDRVLGSDILKAHQKHPKGFETIQEYMEREYRQPKDFEQYVYVSQLLQAGGIKRAIEAHRTARPYCMGTLYWQLNDCWPVVSWSGIDYNNRWKALQYAVRDAYAPVLVKARWKDNKLVLFIDNHTLKPFTASLNIDIMDFGGKVLSTIQRENLEIPANALFMPDKGQEQSLVPADTSRNMMVITLKSEGKTILRQTAFFATPAHLVLPAVAVISGIEAIADGFKLTLQSSVLAKNVWLRLTAGDVFFEDNFFDLIPGEAREVQCKTKLSLDEFTKNLQISSLADSY